MATTSQDNIQLRVVVDGSPARKELAQVNQDLVKLKETQKALVEEQRALNEARKAAKANGDTAEAQRLTQVMEQNRQKLTELNKAVEEHKTKQNELRQQIGDTALSFTELRGKAQGLQAALSRAVPDTPEARKLAAELFTLQQRMKEVGGQAGIQAQAWEHLRQGLKLTDMSMRQLEMESARLKTALEKTRPDTPEFAALHAELGRVDSRMRTLRTGMGPFGQAWAAVKGQIMGATAILGTFLAGGALVNMVTGMVKSSAELSDAIADVRRTTGLTTAQVKDLVQQFKELDTRTPRAELMALAADAGKLGISAKEDVMAFVRAGDQLRVALGEDLGDDAIKNVGKLVDLFRLKEQFGLEQSMLKVGSTLNELGMSSTAAEGYMVEFLKRMGGIAPLAGLTIDQTLALGATLDSLGQTSEVSSTALSKMFVQMAQDAEQYARLAGMSTEEFRTVMSRNALEAFMAVLEGSKRTEGGIIALTETLGQMGVDGSRAAGVFGALANNTDVLAKQLGIAAAAFGEGSSVTDEFRIKNETLAAVLSKMKKEIYETFISTSLVDSVREWIALFREFMAWVRRNGETISAFGRVLLTVGTAFAVYKATVLATTAATRAGIALTTAWTTVKGLFTGAVARATAAQTAFNAVTKLNPIGLVLAGLSAAVMLFDQFSTATKAAADAAANETTKLQILHQQILATNQGSEERRKLIDRLKEQYPEYLQHLDSDKATNDELAKSIKRVNEMLVNKAILSQKDAELEDQNKAVAERKIQLFEAEVKLQELIAAAVKKTGAVLREGTAAEQARQLLTEQGIQKMGRMMTASLSDQLFKVRTYAREVEKEGAKSDAIMQDRQAMVQRFGMDVSESAKKAQGAARSLADVNKEIASLQAVLRNPKAQQELDTGVMQARLDALLKERDALVALGEEGTRTARTLAVINEEIGKLKEQQQQTSTNRDEFLAIEQKIKALEREKVAIEGVQTAGTKARDKELKDLQASEAALAEFEEKMYQLTLNADERELRQLELKHQDELNKLKEHQQKLVAAKKLSPAQAETNVENLTNAQTLAYAGLVEDQERRRFDAVYRTEQEIKQMLSESRSEQLRDTVAHYDRLIETEQLKGRNTVQLEQERYDAVLKFREDELREAVATEMRKWDELIRVAKAKSIDTSALEEARGRAEKAIRRKWLDAQVKDTEDAERRMREARVNSLRQFEQLAGALGGVVQSMSAYMDAGVKAAEARSDADGVRTEAEIANIQRLKEEQRQAALLAIAVQGAAAIANGVASAMTLQPWPAAVAAALSTAGIVLGLMAQARSLMAQGDAASANTNNQGRNGMRPSLNAIPEGAQGMGMRGDGKVLKGKDGGGVLGGSYHGQGNANLLIDSNTGKPLAEVERDELMLIMSRKATAANADLIPRLLEASRRGERLPIMDRPMAMPNPSKVGQAMRVVHMAEGGVVPGSRSVRGTALVNMPTAPGGGGGPIEEMVKQNQQLMAQLQEVFGATLNELRGVRKATESFPRELTATTSIREGERRKVEYDRIQRLNKGRGAA